MSVISHWHERQKSVWCQGNDNRFKNVPESSSTVTDARHISSTDNQILARKWNFWTQQAVFPLPNSLLWKKKQCCWLPDNSSVCSEAVCIFYSLLKIFVPDPSLHLLFVFPIFIVLLLYHKNFSYSFSVSVFQVYLLLWGSSVWGNQDEQQPSLPPPGSHSITSQLPGRRRYDCLSLLSNRTKDTYICLYRYFTYLIWDTDT